MEEVEELLRAHREELSNLQSLVAHAGWKRLMEIADGQKLNRMPVIMKELENLLSVGQQEYAKGEVNGITLFTLLPQKRIEDLKSMIEQTEEELENAPGTSNVPTAGGESRDSGDEFEPASP